MKNISSQNKVLNTKELSSINKAPNMTLSPKSFKQQ